MYKIENISSDINRGGLRKKKNSKKLEKEKETSYRFLTFFFLWDEALVVLKGLDN